MKIVFLHPDLGIGGAERLVVDAAVALKSHGHEPHFVTSHHDKDHCFPETSDGTVPVTVVGDWLPRHIFGRCYALCAYWRMIYAAFYLAYFSKLSPDIVFCDQISACIPVLKLATNARILFYCHFPDQLLTHREDWLKKLYRAPLDWLEEKTTGMADIVMVNSNFTASVFRQTFRSLRNVKLDVLYPSVNFDHFNRPLKGDLSHLKLKKVETVFLSINRYERKKNLPLAIYALEKLLKDLPTNHQNVHLIIAGGFDERVDENREHYEELVELVNELGLESHVSFLKSPSDEEKQLLLHSCTAVIYTPDNEHFGIVPIEAMYMHRPVIAVRSGGPLETVVHDETGILCSPTAESFAEAMKKFTEDHSLAREMGETGHNHVVQNFSYTRFTEQLCLIVDNVMSGEDKKD